MTDKGQIVDKSKSFKLHNYQITVTPISQKTLDISILDPILKSQFSEKNLTLEHIGSSTLLLALQGKRKQITITPHYKKQGQFQIVQLKVIVQSAFLKPIEETLYVKKTGQINQSQFLQRRISALNIKLKNLKQQGPHIKGQIYYNFKLEEQSFNGSQYQPLISLKLKRGKYILTFSFIMKATNQWIYIYMNQGQVIMTNCGYYVPSNTNWIPFTIRKVYTVNEESKQVSFTTYCANSYPVTLRNRIVTAHPLP